VPQVAGERLAATGVVGADDDRPGQRRRAEEEDVLGEVVQEDADVPAGEAGGLQRRRPGE
jgi:hypothetical protein